MEIFNIETSERYKATGYISNQLGGSYSFRETFDIGGKGISGLKYSSGIFKDNVEDIATIDTTIEKYKNGIGLYLRSRQTNHLLLIPNKEIKGITIEKKNDLILPTNKSLFLKLLNYNIAYHFAKIFILEKEEVELNKYLVTISLKDNSDIVLSISRLNPYKVINFIEDSLSHLAVKVNINSFLLLDHNNDLL